MRIITFLVDIKILSRGHKKYAVKTRYIDFSNAIESDMLQKYTEFPEKYSI